MSNKYVYNLRIQHQRNPDRLLSISLLTKTLNSDC